jgi:NAD(P)-dependent dehydrogenase (short-subunit alcohol dehydrogenase family)
MSCLREKRCLITGAAGGIGAALSRRLAKAGCRLLLTGRDESKLADLAGELGDKAQGVYPADLADAAQVEDLVTRVGRDGVDILVNNAGVFPVLSLEDSTPDELDRCLAVNLRAPFVLARAFAGGMKTRRWGRIVNIGSSSAYAGFQNTSIYCTSKHALLGLSRSLHAELKDHGVRSFFVAPGSVQTEMGRLVPGQDFSTFIDPEDLARYVEMAVSFDGNMVAEEARLGRMEIR